ncbi:hypothetical protein K9N50_04605 [bacterium]|nr:hypothetical protein [bacterium]
MKHLRIYLDTSVFGGYFDAEFIEASRKLFDEIRNGQSTLVLSETTLRELDDAPKHVQELLKSIPNRNLEIVVRSDEVSELRDAYITAGVVGSNSLYDAEHIAFATVAGVDMIVSWNFKHIVNYRKIKGYHAVNILNGYQPISIHCPSEVIES